ncbi:bifunctional DNA-formamidopyrimidine glycosylase/DNA-(apurinic or apyrimidinic site) lyase [Haloechinothrix sp. YIM 98757]|uniref:Formamidopyrimidine-DNA glycosylase n=1 Tax=Haloechinothrix aidingensis TaxID=2752311 RepID=A0A838A149_9PSEU|nr:bifunctional DNA-formamidopyrimidine glycosylase/DNA-(apurinic or apyrimidinic site) lyase [Haloechinothrix aidingensis]
MPELPEVEVIRAGLAEHIVDRTLSDVEVLHPRAVRRYVPGPDDFRARLLGERVEAVRRRGKYLWLELASGIAVLGHLGMSGQLRVQPVGAPDEKHLRVRMRFADGGDELRFVDQRTFGGLQVTDLRTTQGGQVPAEIVHIARDPVDPDFRADDVVRVLRARRSEVKRGLLDQSLVSGIGNIYADEALWRARLHGACPTWRLTRKQGRELFRAVAEVLDEALTAGGTSFDALYVNVNGQSGYFSRALAVYGRDGEPCERCAALIRREDFMNRSSYFCPGCQPRPRSGRRGRTGPPGTARR